MRGFLAAVMLASLVPSAAAGQQAAPSPAPAAPLPAAAPAPAYRTVDVVLTTNEGAITIAVEVERAPITSANFLKYVDGKRYDGATFYRALNMGEDYGLLQGGVSRGDRLLPPIAHEPTTRTGLSHKTGTVSLARAEEGSGRSDFFIVVGDMSALDAHPEKPGDNSGFAAFGRVVSGMDVVRKLMAGAISPTKGADNGMQGQMLEQAVPIVTARRAKP